MARAATQPKADFTRVVAFIINGAATVQRILSHIGTPAMWENGLADAVRDWDDLAYPEPKYQFDHPVQW